MKETQQNLILSMLREGPKVTADFAKTNLSCEFRARISELRNKGYGILAERISQSSWLYSLTHTPTELI